MSEDAVVPREFWVERLVDLFGVSPETCGHPHVPEERAERYRAVDSGSTELEVLEFLHALIRLYKPERALETGSFRGIGTIALASALRRNERGRLVTVECNRQQSDAARGNVERFDPALLDWIDFVASVSVQWLERDEGPRYDFVFLDSDMRDRIAELQALLERDRLSPGAICVVHDASIHRVRYPPPLNEGLAGRDEFDRLLAEHQGLDFPYSRGFRLIRFTGDDVDTRAPADEG